MWEKLLEKRTPTAICCIKCPCLPNELETRLEIIQMWNDSRGPTRDPKHQNIIRNANKKHQMMTAKNKRSFRLVSCSLYECQDRNWHWPVRSCKRQDKSNHLLWVTVPVLPTRTEATINYYYFFLKWIFLCCMGYQQKKIKYFISYWQYADGDADNDTRSVE